MSGCVSECESVCGCEVVCLSVSEWVCVCDDLVRGEEEDMIGKHG